MILHRPQFAAAVVLAIGLFTLSTNSGAVPPAATAPTTKSNAPFAMGADLSLLQFIEDHGVQYREDGQAKDPLTIFKDHGCNYVRLRLFVEPNGKDGQVNALAYTLRLARRVKAAGLRLLLDFHYSDAWADPSHQFVPAHWRELSHPQLVERLFTYTRDTLGAFQREGCAPDIVAVGNEITSGMMWPDGGPLTDAKWGAFADLLKAAVRGVRTTDPTGTIRVMIHIDKGGDKGVSRWFFEHLQRQGVPFDVIGLSFYPMFKGTLPGLRENLAALAQTYGKDIIVVETDYDTASGLENPPPFPHTPDGQRAFLEELIRTVAATPGGHGKGVFYWAPEWIMSGRWGGNGQWDHRALFDSTGNVLPAMRAFELSTKEQH